MYTYNRRRVASGISDVDGVSAEEQENVIREFISELENWHNGRTELAILYQQAAKAVESRRLLRIGLQAAKDAKDIEAITHKLKEIATILPKTDEELDRLFEDAERRVAPSQDDVKKLSGYAQLETLGKEVAYQIKKWDDFEYSGKKVDIRDFITEDTKSRLAQRIEHIEQTSKVSVEDHSETLSVALGFIAYITDEEYISDRWESSRPDDEPEEEELDDENE